MGWDELRVGRDRLGSDEIRWDQMGSDGTGWGWIGWDQWNGMGWDGIAIGSRLDPAVLDLPILDQFAMARAQRVCQIRVIRRIMPWL